MNLIKLPGECWNIQPGRRKNGLAFKQRTNFTKQSQSKPLAFLFGGVHM